MTYIWTGGGLQVRGDGDEEVPERNAGRGEVRRGASSGAQEGERVSIFQQIVETSASSQSKQLRSPCGLFALRKQCTHTFSVFQVNLFKNYIPEAFPDGDDLILDSEILMIDTTTGQPLPFGTLGVHKVRMFVKYSATILLVGKSTTIFFYFLLFFSESRIQRRQCLPVYFRLHLLQRRRFTAQVSQRVSSFILGYRLGDFDRSICADL